METVNLFLADPVPFVVAAVFTFWLWHTDPDVVLLLALAGGLWWWLA